MSCIYMLYILIFIIFSHVDKTSSKDIISLEFRFKKDTLKLICKVWRPSLSINIYNTQEKIIARCLTFPTKKCDCFEKNGEIAFNEYTNETILKVWNKPSVNGIWTCRHGGSKYDSAAKIGIDVEQIDVSTCVSALIFCLVFIAILIGVLVFVCVKYFRSREKNPADETESLGVFVDGESQ